MNDQHHKIESWRTVSSHEPRVELWQTMIGAATLIAILGIFAWIKGNLPIRAEWVEAIGTIAAVGVAIYVPWKIHKNEQKEDLIRRKRRVRLYGSNFANNLRNIGDWAQKFLEYLNQINGVNSSCIRHIGFPSWKDLHAPNLDFSDFDEAIIDDYNELVLRFDDYTKKRDNLLAELEKQEKNWEAIVQAIRETKITLERIEAMSGRLAEKIDQFIGKSSHNRSSNS